MNPIIVDVILGVISVLLIWNGCRHGFIRAAGSLLGLIISIGTSIWGITWLEDLTGFDLTSNPAVFIVAFLILVILLSQLLRLVVSALDLVRRAVSIIPFVGLLNTGLGLVLGVIQAVVMIGLLAYLTVTYVPTGTIQTAILDSTLVDTSIDYAGQLGIF